MVRVEKDYAFDGPDGAVSLLDMFEGRSQLYIHHFMWLDADCPSCTAAADLTFTDRDRKLLHTKGVTFACVSRAPYESIARYRDQHGWTFPWYSSRDGGFTYDLRGDWPGASVFLRRGDEVCHTYSAYARGLDHSAVGYPFLDLTPYGRQEPWEDSPAGWPQGRAVVGRPVGDCCEG